MANMNTSTNSFVPESGCSNSFVPNDQPNLKGTNKFEHPNGENRQ
jgi:hypothetical protein